MVRHNFDGKLGQSFAIARFGLFFFVLAKLPFIYSHLIIYKFSISSDSRQLISDFSQQETTRYTNLAPFHTSTWCRAFSLVDRVQSLRCKSRCKKFNNFERSPTVKHIFARNTVENTPFRYVTTQRQFVTPRRSLPQTKSNSLPPIQATYVVKIQWEKNATLATAALWTTCELTRTLNPIDVFSNDECKKPTLGAAPFCAVISPIVLPDEYIFKNGREQDGRVSRCI